MLLIGHRGAKAYEPENTLKSFKKGVKLGANAIEFDVRLSKDGTPVVIHDATLDRTTNGTGKVAENTLKKLRSLDAGSGEKIPTLREALQFCKKHNVTPVVELKEKDITAIIDVIKKTKSKPLVISYNSDALKKIKAKHKTIQTGLIIANNINNITGLMKLGKAIKLDWFFIRGDVITKTLMDTAHKWHYNVLIWLTNSKTAAKKYKRLGADGLASDKPDIYNEL